MIWTQSVSNKHTLELCVVFVQVQCPLPLILYGVPFMPLILPLIVDMPLKIRDIYDQDKCRKLAEIPSKYHNFAFQINEKF